MNKGKDDEGLNIFWYFVPFIIMMVLSRFFTGILEWAVSMGIGFFIVWIFNRKRWEDVKGIMKPYIILFLIGVVIVILVFGYYTLV
jgi:hypothetical protein